MRPIARIAVVFLLAACSRYEWVPDYLSPECGKPDGVPPAHAGPPLHVQSATRLDRGAIAGSVIQAGTGLPVDGARIALSTVPAVGAITDSVGRFEIRDVAPGRYAVVIRRIGFTTTRDSIVVPEEGGLRIDAELQMAPLDGPCSGFGLVRVRKPWWKLW